MAEIPERLHNTIGSNHGADQLRAYFKKLQNLEDQIADLNADKSDLYKEAKAAGFDPKIMRKVRARLRRPSEDVEEEDMLIQTYESVAKDPLA